MMPNETLVDVLVNLSRHDFDILELVNRALGSLIHAKFTDAPKRVISLMFNEEGLVMLTCPSDGWRRLPIIELPQYIARSGIKNIVFKKTCSGGTLAEEMYQALRPCRAHFAADAVCDFRTLSVFPPDILYRSLTEVFKCTTFVFAQNSYIALSDLHGEQHLAALPCIANCTNLQIEDYQEAFFDASGALEWLLGTHAVAAGVKHLSIRDINIQYLDVFPSALIVAIEEQFMRATTSASFNVDLLFFVGHVHGPDIGTTREHVNADTNEQLKVDVDADVRKPNGEPAYKTKVTIPFSDGRSLR